MSEKELLKIAHDAIYDGLPIPYECVSLVGGMIGYRLSRIEEGERSFIFSRAEGGWLIGEEIDPIYVKTRKKGYQYINTILRNNGDDLSCRDLKLEDITVPYVEVDEFDQDEFDQSAYMRGSNERSKLTEWTDRYVHVNAKADSRAFDDVIKAKRELDKKINNGVYDDAELEEKKAVSDELGKWLIDVGSERYPRKFDDDGEKARQTVSKSINSVINEITVYHSPSLGEHLAKSIKTGYFVSYEPGIKPVWTFD